MKKLIIAPANVKLLIFDLDGTLHVAARTEFESIKRGFAKLNLELWFSEKEIEKYFGRVSGDGFFMDITPPDKRAMWPDVKNAVRAEYEQVMWDFACLYPGVKETLATLRSRGYKLVLCSNSSSIWFSAAISALGLKDYFDYCECFGQNKLTKTQIVGKIKDMFDICEIAEIGDTKGDIEAARENGALSVGVLYGYGGDDPKKADITINAFPDLLSIFDRRLPVFEKILLAVKRRKRDDKAFVIGVTGIDASGKTKFAEALAGFLNSRGCNVQLVRLDDFHNPKEMRYAGKNQAENYYIRSFDLETIIQRLLIPIRTNGKISTELTLLNLHTNKYEVSKKYFVDEGTIVIFEGVFLFRCELSPYLNYKIFLEIPFEESKRRAVTRDVPIYGKEILDRYEGKYLPAEKRYLDEYPPLQTSDMIIDNVNWEYPKTKFIR